MHRNITILICYFFLSAILSSCGMEEPKYLAKEEIPDELYEEINESLLIDAVISYKPEKDFYSSYKLNAKSHYDENLLSDLFFFNESPVVKKNDYGELSMKTDKKSLIISGYFNYFTNHYMNYLSIVEYLPSNDIQSFRESFNGYPVDNELQGFPRETAIAQAEEIMKSLALNNADEPLICSGITADTLKAFSKVDIIQDYYKQYDLGNPEYTMEDEFYYMVYQLSIDGFPLFECNYRKDLTNIPALTECGSYVILCIGRNEILQVRTGINFQTIIDSEQAAHKLISFSVILDKITDYFDNYIISGTMNVKKIDFQYLAVHNMDGTYSAIPAWIVYSVNSSNPSQATLIFIDAITGDFIYL